MPLETIEQVLMQRDGLTKSEANTLIQEAKTDLTERLWDEDTFGDPYDICKDWFGLEPDYMLELL